MALTLPLTEVEARLFLRLKLQPGEAFKPEDYGPEELRKAGLVPVKLARDWEDWKAGTTVWVDPVRAAELKAADMTPPPLPPPLPSDEVEVSEAIGEEFHA